MKMQKVIQVQDITESAINELIKGIFIYPTDTIYGIGCNAEDENLVKKIQEIKHRESEKPLSIIAPSFDYILKNCDVDLSYLEKYLPGKYTLILKKKNPRFLKHVSVNAIIGIRIPDNNFTKLLQKTGKPIITTSVNLSGESPIKEINEIPKEILERIDFVVDAGVLCGKPSTLIKEGRVLKR